MKTLYIFLFIVLGGFKAAEGSMNKMNRKNSAPVNTTVTIHFQKEPIDSLFTYIWDGRNFMNYQQITSAKVTGTQYTFRVKLGHPVMIGFFIGDLSLFRLNYAISNGYLLEPGDQLHLEVGNDLDNGILNISFSGKGAAKFRMIQEKIRTMHAIPRKAPIFMNLAEKFSAAKEDQKIWTPILNKYRDQLSKTAYDCIRAGWTMDAYSASVTALLHGVADTANADYYNKYIPMIKAVAAKEDALYDYQDYALLGTIADMEYLMMTKKDLPKNFFRDHPEIHCQNLAAAYSGRVNRLLKSQFIVSRSIAKGFDEQMQQCAANYLTENKSDQSSETMQVRQMQDAFFRQLGENQKAFPFALPDTTGKMIRQSDLSGKVVLVDFFFNGCAGCYTTVPYLDSLERIYKGKNVAFVAVSIDKDESTWKAGISRFSSKQAVQVYTNNTGSNHPMIQFYRISSYPSMVLIDKEGRIISSRVPDIRTNEGWNKTIAMIDAGLKN